MINHMDIKVRNLERSKRFYAQLLESLDYSLKLDNPHVFSLSDGISTDPCGDIYFSVGKPTRHHFAFQAENPEQVQKFYEKALSLGAVDNGAPGIRVGYHPHYYACYVIDLEGYPIECVCHG